MPKPLTLFMNRSRTRRKTLLRRKKGVATSTSTCAFDAPVSYALQVLFPLQGAWKWYEQKTKSSLASAQIHHRFCHQYSCSARIRLGRARQQGETPRSQAHHAGVAPSKPYSKQKAGTLTVQACTNKGNTGTKTK